MLWCSYCKKKPNVRRSQYSCTMLLVQECHHNCYLNWIASSSTLIGNHNVVRSGKLFTWHGLSGDKSTPNYFTFSSYHVIHTFLCSRKGGDSFRILCISDICSNVICSLETSIELPHIHKVQ